MAFEKMIQNAFEESRNNCRFGDTLEEINEIQDYIRNAKKIYVPNKNGIKVFETTNDLVKSNDDYRFYLDNEEYHLVIFDRPFEDIKPIYNLNVEKSKSGGSPISHDKK